MGPVIIRFKSISLLLAVVFLLSSFGHVEALHACSACMDPEFADLVLRFYQNQQNHRGMGLVRELMKYPCQTGNYTTMMCENACMRVDVVKLQVLRPDKTVIHSELAATMLDCSTLVLHFTPLAERGENFKEYKKNRTFTDVIEYGSKFQFEFRFNFTTYTLSPEDINAITADLKTTISARVSSLQIMHEYGITQTNLFLFAVLATVIGVFIFCIVNSCCMGRAEREDDQVKTENGTMNCSENMKPRYNIPRLVELDAMKCFDVIDEVANKENIIESRNDNKNIGVSESMTRDNSPLTMATPIMTSSDYSDESTTDYNHEDTYDSQRKMNAGKDIREDSEGSNKTSTRHILDESTTLHAAN